MEESNLKLCREETKLARLKVVHAKTTIVSRRSLQAMDDAYLDVTLQEEVVALAREQVTIDYQRSVINDPYQSQSQYKIPEQVIDDTRHIVKNELMSPTTVNQPISINIE